MKNSPSISEIGRIFRELAHLDWRVLCVFISSHVPRDAVPIQKINRCIARSSYVLAKDPTTPPIYLDPREAEGVCPGGLVQLGLSTPAPMLKYFVSVGEGETGKAGGRSAEFLRANPDLVDQAFDNLGTKHPPEKFLHFVPCEAMDAFPGQQPTTAAIICFGQAESIRNLGALLHFRSTQFDAILMPWGAACGTLFVYPLHLAENVPTDKAFIGPVDPTANNAFPPDFMALSIPLLIARQMAVDAEESFLGKRPTVAFPSQRIELEYPLRTQKKLNLRRELDALNPRA